MTNLENVAVAVPPPGANDDAIADRADRRAGCGGVVGSLVLLPDTENRMEAPAEGAGNTPELERRPEERRAHRLAILVEEVPADTMAGVANRFIRKLVQTSFVTPG